MGKISEKPLYTHDCDHCHFLGTYNNTDLYCCDGFYRTLISRESSEGSEYCSCPETILEREKSYPNTNIMEAYRRSKEIPYPFKLKVRKLMDKLGIHRTRVDRKKELLHLTLCHLANLLDMCIFFCTLTKYSSNFHGKVVFWDYFDED